MVATMTPHQKTRLVLTGSGGDNDDTPSKKPAWYWGVMVATMTPHQKNPLGIDWEWWWQR
jgi:hypothetical protein